MAVQLTGGLLGMAAILAWLTHIVWSIRILVSDVSPTMGKVAMAVIGAIVPPVGVLHGFLIWLGLGG